MTPPSPWIGSRRTAAVLPVVALLIASTSLNGTRTNPSTSGVNGARYFSVAVAVTVARVRPWKAPSATMISKAPSRFSFPHLRASLMHPSTASAPLLQKNTLSSPVCSHRSCASLIWGCV